MSHVTQMIVYHLSKIDETACCAIFSPLSFSLSVYLSLPFSLSLSPSLSLTPALSHSLSLSLYFSSLSLSLSPSLSLSLSFTRSRARFLSDQSLYLPMMKRRKPAGVCASNGCSSRYLQRSSPFSAKACVYVCMDGYKHICLHVCKYVSM